VSLSDLNFITNFVKNSQLVQKLTGIHREYELANLPLCLIKESMLNTVFNFIYMQCDSSSAVTSVITDSYLK
jgi:hypothetical protein